MSSQSFDLLVIGGGIHGAAVARDAAGRGLKVMLAEKGDYACATSSASSKLIHGGLRYLEHLEVALVRESLTERAELLRTAPHLVSPLKFLLPIYDWQKRSAWFVHAGLALYDLMSFGDGLPASGRLSAEECARLPRLRQKSLDAVLHYHDAHADDARLTVSVALDARIRGADILNRRAVTAIEARPNSYAVELDERGTKRRVDAHFIVNAAGSFVPEIEAMTDAAPPAAGLRLVRGSHIVLPMPQPADNCAYTLQDEGERVIFVIPWLEGRFLIVGTTDVPHDGAPGHVRCSPEERAYLLDAYNRYFAGTRAGMTEKDIVYEWSGVRTLHAGRDENPSRISRTPTLAAKTNGTGGFLTVYGGKLTTHRAMAEDVLARLAHVGLEMGAPWTKNAPFYGGSERLDSLLARAGAGPEAVSPETRERWAKTYGDRIDVLLERTRADPDSADDIAPGVPRAELEHAVEEEDAMTGEDFLLRRTKLHLLLDDAGRDAIGDWFAKH